MSAIRLSAKAAERLDKKLGLRGVFKTGQLLGSSTTDAQPGTVTVKEGGRAGLSLAPAFASKLSSLFVAVNLFFPAEHLRLRSRCGSTMVRSPPAPRVASSKPQDLWN